MAILIDASKPLLVAQPVGGPRGKLNRLDVKKLGIGLLLGLAGTALPYGTEFINGVDWGPFWTPIVTVAGGVIVATLRKLLDGSGYQKAVEALRKGD